MVSDMEERDPKAGSANAKTKHFSFIAALVRCRVTKPLRFVVRAACPWLEVAGRCGPQRVSAGLHGKSRRYKYRSWSSACTNVLWLNLL